MSIYQNLYDLIMQYVYGGVTPTADMQLICTLIATIGCLFVVAMPFIIVWFIIKTLTNVF